MNESKYESNESKFESNTNIDNNSSIKSQKKTTLYCLRHAQSEYNLAIRSLSTWLSTDFWSNCFDPMLRDPNISKDIGQQQIRKTMKLLEKNDFLNQQNIELFVSSPLKRAIDTCLGVFQSSSNIKCMVNPLLSEQIYSLSDIGTYSSDLTSIYSHSKCMDIDFSLLARDIWWIDEKINGNKKAFEHLNKNGSVIAESDEHLQLRIKQFKQWITERPEENIVVIGHSHWIKMFVNASLKLGNCQMMKVDMIGSDIIKWSIFDLL